ncbi:MAG: LysR family transcriptional regulator [Pseudomonadota bacterium]
MDWDKLRVFHAVADAGSLTHAGDQLHLSQSAISRQIRGLELQLQATLFHRHARGLLLTEQGEILYETTKTIAKSLTSAAARIRDAKDAVFGELRVTTTAGFGTLWLAPRLARLMDAHPSLKVELILTESVLDLPMREADVAIRLVSPNQAELIRRPLMNAVMRLYATKEYLDRHGLPDSVAALADHRVLAFSATAPQPRQAAEFLDKLGLSGGGIDLRMNSYFGVLKAALNHLGVALLPDYLTRDNPELVHVLPEEASEPITVWFVYPEELRHSQRVLAFRDFVLSEVEALSPRGKTARHAPLA